jgi:hypothetical protein
VTITPLLRVVRRQDDQPAADDAHQHHPLAFRLRRSRHMSLSGCVRRRMRQPALLLSVASLSLTAACATSSMSVNELMKDPGRYHGRSVSVTGVVTHSASIAGHGIYRIEDGGAALWVASRSGVPNKGMSVIVDGRIYDVYDVRGLPLPVPAAVGSGVMLLETSRAIGN